MEDLVAGITIGVVWAALTVLLFTLWEDHVHPRITAWIDRRAEQRLVDTDRFTPEEAADVVAGWRRRDQD